MGDLSLIGQKSIAVIGSRNCSEYGRRMTEELTRNLVLNDVVIVSGLAIGIDSIAHETCLNNGGKTIAVLGSGFNNIYPKENEKLFRRIIENGGLVISEYSIETVVQKKNFPRRNRIISALADGVLVIEAGYRSGTSITANYARQQNKKIFCIPNSIGNKNSYGAIELAKSGAKIITDASEILNEIGVDVKENSEFRVIEKNKKILGLNKEASMVYECLKENSCLYPESISLKTGVDIVLVNQLLIFLEMEEIVECTELCKYSLRKEFCE